MKKNYPKYLLLIGFSLLSACGQHASSKLQADTTTKDSSADEDTTHYTFARSDTNATSCLHDPIAVTPDLVPFIPVGYAILDAITGDLNRDSIPDMILILKRLDEDSLSKISDTDIQRPLLILIGQPDRSYKLAARNDSAVDCVKCGGPIGDPYQETVIKNGYFSNEYYGGGWHRWSRTVTFKYVKADSAWYLHKDGHLDFAAVDIDSTEKDTTYVYSEKDFGKIPFTRFSIVNNRY
jgi:hypothetical protein